MRDNYRKYILGGIGLAVFAYIFFVVAPNVFGEKYKAGGLVEVVKGTSTTTEVFVATHVPPPSPVKGIYMTSCVAGTPLWRESLKKLIEKTELNAVVIDIKDYTGTITITDPSLQGDVSKGCRVKDLRDFIEELHKSNIYVIGRISVFQDSYYTALHPELAVRKISDGGVWKDRKGLSFIDVGARPYWDYIVTISKVSYALGFDELNYDYVRYPSDGNISDIKLNWLSSTSTTMTSTSTSSTKPEILKSFFAYLHNQMKDTGAKLSVDIFGMTTTVTDDMGIGQILENTFPYFDFIDPMVYPSHYPSTWEGFKNPAEHPYEVIKIAMTEAKKREEAWDLANGIATSTPSKLRPWLQDFDLGADYGVSEVQAQMKATYDSGLKDWLVWDAGNKYTPSAYKSE